MNFNSIDIGKVICLEKYSVVLVRQLVSGYYSPLAAVDVVHRRDSGSRRAICVVSDQKVPQYFISLVGQDHLNFSQF